MPAATLTAPQTDLFAQIREHLAHVDATYGFTARLARENGWKPDFARAVTDEYAKFLFIAREGGHPVSPPPIIDKAWHLHLVHTEDYWGTFCPNILKMQLHHSPATGTHDEAAKFADWSGMTVASYQKFFGPPPPMWMPPGQRRRREQAPAAKLGVLLFAGGIVTVAGGVGANSPTAIVVGFFLCVAGVVMLIATHASAAQGGNGSSSCGGDSGGGSDGGSPGGHGGGHGGGHSCGGGHGCGGHGCSGGGGCGGGGH